MIIKKFQAFTEEDAIKMAKDEMGPQAIVLNIKKTKHRGISRLFKKDVVEVTAALEEKSTTNNIPIKAINVAVDDRFIPEMKMQNDKTVNAIEEKLNNLQNILENRMNDRDKDEKTKEDAEKIKEKDFEESKNFKFLQLIYNQMLENEVDEKYANQIIGEIQLSAKKEANVDSILAAVYQKIILKIGQPKSIDIEDKKPRLVFFVGPTGVGKTTTIAKLASHFKLEKKIKVALITSDTFRIAAVEQLRTYANILDVPLQVIYTVEEFNRAVSEYKDYDLILVDTAGRSHKNDEQCDEMLHLIRDCSVDENIIKDVYLVLSAATKYKDLIKINERFSVINNYSLIFTKLDETSCLGNILNMKLKTGVPVSYVTSGQVVPDDISVIDAQTIARSLLGSNE